VDLGPGELLTRMTAGSLRGQGIGMIAAATRGGLRNLLTPGAAPEVAPAWTEFAPKPVTLPGGRIGVETSFTKLTGRSPILLAGMTPTTVDAKIVAAAANAGHWAELAGGGQVTESIFEDRVAELKTLLEPGRGVQFNSLFLDPYLWKLQLGGKRLVQPARPAGAPFDGVVGIRSVSPGDYVKEGDTLVNVEDIATLKADFRLPEAYLDRVRRGQVLALASDVLPDERFAAEVDAIDPLVDAQGRSIVLRAKLANPEGRLRPGMFVRVRVMLAERPGVLVVPEEALVPAPGGAAYVYRVVDERAQRVDVKTGARRDAQVEILEGLTPGDVVVTAGQLKLRDGARVTLAAAAEVRAARAVD